MRSITTREFYKNGNQDVRPGRYMIHNSNIIIIGNEILVNIEFSTSEILVNARDLDEYEELMAEFGLILDNKDKEEKLTNYGPILYI